MPMKELVCQSCGMPMVATEHFGTEKNNRPSKDYCCYCYQQGHFTEKLTLEQTIESNLEYPDSLRTQEGKVLSKEEAALKMRLQLITLKRWKVNEKTQEEYFQAVNRALDYIQRNIQDTLDLSMLAGVANISRFHFHRIFKAIMNESPGEYIQRIRLESVAFKLQTTSMNLTQIAEQIGYQSQYALSKSFKKYFNIAPSHYRKQPSDLSIPIRKSDSRISCTPDIRTVDSREVICLRIANPYINPDAFTKAWRKLLRFTRLNGIPDGQNEYFTLSMDVPTITRPDNQRIYACIRTSVLAKPSGEFSRQTIEGGPYAVFTWKGPYDRLHELYCYIYRSWIPDSNYQLRDCVMFEKYLNTPDEVSEQALLTEIYIPISLPTPTP